MSKFDEHDNDILREIAYNKDMKDIVRDDIKIEMNRRLIDAINQFDKTSSNQSNTMINLTKWIMWLTIAIGVLTSMSVIKLFLP